MVRPKGFRRSSWQAWKVAKTKVHKREKSQQSVSRQINNERLNMCSCILCSVGFGHTWHAYLPVVKTSLKSWNDGVKRLEVHCNCAVSCACSMNLKSWTLASQVALKYDTVVGYQEYEGELSVLSSSGKSKLLNSTSSAQLPSSAWLCELKLWASWGKPVFDQLGSAILAKPVPTAITELVRQIEPAKVAQLRLGLAHTAAETLVLMISARQVSNTHLY